MPPKRKRPDKGSFHARFIEGRIAAYYPDRGYGFIEGDALNESVFFHYTNISGGEGSDLYRELNKGKNYHTIRVRFILHEDPRGPQARNIQLILPPSPYSPLTDFLNSIQSPTLETENQFLKLISFQALDYVGANFALTQIAVSKIVRSPETWSNLTELANNWVFCCKILRPGRSLSVEEQASCEALAREIAQQLGFQPHGKPETSSDYPIVEQPVIHDGIPLKYFRQAHTVSILIIPNMAILTTICSQQPILLTSGQNSIRLVVILDENGEDELLKVVPDSLRSQVIIVPQRTIIGLMMGTRIERPIILGRVIRETIPIYRLQPYEVSSAYSEAIFAGRAQERNRILESIETNHAIYGGRKIGKTWFLKDICYWCKKDPHTNSLYAPFYASLQASENLDDAVDIVIETIRHNVPFSPSQAERPTVRLRNTLQKAREVTGKTVLLALDEIDDLLVSDGAYQFFAALRQMQQTYPGSYKYIFAGFKELIHSFYDEKSNNPFANWIARDNHFPLGCLTPSDVSSLIIEPLKWMGFEFSSQGIVEKIFELTSGHPYYTQLLCSQIIENQVPPSLTPKMIEKLASDEFFHEIFGVFTNNLSSVQMLIGKVFQGTLEPFSDMDIINELDRQFGIRLTEQQVFHEMKVLQACSIFSREAGGYRPVMERINEEFFRSRSSEDIALRYLEEVENAD